MRYSLILILCLIVKTTFAASVIRIKGEDAATFAARLAPNRSAEVVKVIESSEWNFVSPVIIAFYKYPVTFADKNKFYGDDPNDSVVIGYLYVPISASEYERIEIDSYGPEGGNAEIVNVYFSKIDKQAKKSLLVDVHWYPQPGEIQQVCAYSKPQLNPPPKKLMPLNEPYRCN